MLETSNLMWFRFLTVATVLSILQALAKGAELLLDSEQQKTFQKAINTLTLRLIDLNPIRHYRRLSERKVQVIWLGISVLIAWTTSLASFGWRLLLHSGWASVYALAIPGLMYFPFRMIVSWLARSANALRMIVKAMAFLLLGSAAFTALWIEFYDDEYGPPLFISLPFFIIAAPFFYAAVIVVLIYTAQGAAWLLKHVFWRIATSAKGAWSAFIIVLAALLAVAESVVAIKR